MGFNETDVTRAIIKESSDILKEIISPEVIIAGAGPSGMTCARYLARAGIDVVILERDLSFGGGIWGGGTLLPRIVIQEEAGEILREIDVNLKDAGKGLYTADPVETSAKLASSAIDAGAKIIPGMLVEDVVVRGERVEGAVVIWNAIQKAKLHVDPISFSSKYLVDATGHEADVVKTYATKNKTELYVSGEKSMWADEGEKKIIENTREVAPGLLVTGMACNAVYGSYRMGPIFGGMFLSGKKAADIILEKLGKG